MEVPRGEGGRLRRRENRFQAGEGEEAKGGTYTLHRNERRGRWKVPASPLPRPPLLAWLASGSDICYLEINALVTLGFLLGLGGGIPEQLRCPAVGPATPPSRALSWLSRLGIWELEKNGPAPCPLRWVNSERPPQS